jgi:predicted dienelactone hydrolase
MSGAREARGGASSGNGAPRMDPSSARTCLTCRSPRARTTLLAPIVLATALGLCAPCSRAATEQSVQIDGVDTVVWMPEEKAQHPLPIVVFSHGLYTCATQSRFITRAIADAGYFVIAPNHEDSACAFTLGWLGFSRLPGKPAMLWTDADYRDRADDIRAIVAALPHDARFRDTIDIERLALAGHSLGGYTVLGLAGAWPGWQLPGIKAVLAFAPYAMPFSRSEGFRHLAVPVMYQAGGFDPAFTRAVHRAFEQSPFPKYYIEIDKAWHLAWTDVGGMHRDEIIANAITFLDMYVKPVVSGATAATSLVPAKPTAESSIN